MRGGIRAVALFALCAAAACARKTVAIENRYSRGDELSYRLVTRSVGTTSMAGLPGAEAKTETPVKMEMELRYKTLVKDVDARGTAEIETGFERFASLSESGGFAVRIEADGKGARVIHGETVSRDSPGLDELKAFFAKPMASTVDKRGKTLSPARAGAGGGILPQMDLNNALQHGQFILPEGPIAVGGSWSDERSAALGGSMAVGAPGAGRVGIRTRYTLVRLVNRGGRTCAEIALRGELDMKDVAVNPAGAAAHGVGLQTVFDRLKQTDTGTIFFDIRRGRLMEMHVDSLQEISMTMKVPGAGAGRKLVSATKLRTSSDLKLVE